MTSDAASAREGGLDRRAISLLLLASALWGSALTGSKYALSGFDPFTLLFLELAFATLALWIVLLLRGFRPPRSYKLPLILGLLEPGLANLGQSFGLSRTSAADGSVVSGLEAAFVVVLAAAFLRERITRVTAIAVCLAFVGLLVLSGGDPFAGSGIGDLYVALGVLSASAYTIVVKKFSHDLDDVDDALALTACQFAAATVLALVVVAGRWGAGSQPSPAAVPLRFWVVAALVGVCGSALSFVLFNATISRVKAGSASIVLNAIPLFGVVTAILFLGETVRTESLLGALLIALSVGCFIAVENRVSALIDIPSPRKESAGLVLGVDLTSRDDEDGITLPAQTLPTHKEAVRLDRPEFSSRSDASFQSQDEGGTRTR